MKKIAVLTILLLVMSFAAIANAGPFDYLVGDKDGFGFGAPDQGLFTNPWPAYPPLLTMAAVRLNRRPLMAPNSPTATARFSQVIARLA